MKNKSTSIVDISTGWGAQKALIHYEGDCPSGSEIKNILKKEYGIKDCNVVSITPSNGENVGSIWVDYKREAK